LEVCSFMSNENSKNNGRGDGAIELYVPSDEERKKAIKDRGGGHPNTRDIKYILGVYSRIGDVSQTSKVTTWSPPIIRDILKGRRWGSKFNHFSEEEIASAKKDRKGRQATNEEEDWIAKVYLSEGTVRGTAFATTWSQPVIRRVLNNRGIKTWEEDMEHRDGHYYKKLKVEEDAGFLDDEVRPDYEFKNLENAVRYLQGEGYLISGRVVKPTGRSEVSLRSYPRSWYPHIRVSKDDETKKRIYTGNYMGLAYLTKDGGLVFINNDDESVEEVQNVLSGRLNQLKKVKRLN
jgi:hypothetical protein